MTSRGLWIWWINEGGKHWTSRDLATTLSPSSTNPSLRLLPRIGIVLAKTRWRLSQLLPQKSWLIIHFRISAFVQSSHTYCSYIDNFWPYLCAWHRWVTVSPGRPRLSSWLLSTGSRLWVQLVMCFHVCENWKEARLLSVSFDLRVLVMCEHWS